MSEEVTPPHAPSDPVEMRRLMYQTPAMVSHPPIPVSILAQHIEMLKANDNLKFSQEYEVCIGPTLICKVEVPTEWNSVTA